MCLVMRIKGFCRLVGWCVSVCLPVYVFACFCCSVFVCRVFSCSCVMVCDIVCCGFVARVSVIHGFSVSGLGGSGF